MDIASLSQDVFKTCKDLSGVISITFALLYGDGLVDLWKLLPVLLFSFSDLEHCKLSMFSLFLVDNIASLVLFHRCRFLEPQEFFTTIFTLEFSVKDRLPVHVWLVYERKVPRRQEIGSTFISSSLLFHRMMILKHFSQMILFKEIHSL